MLKDFNELIQRVKGSPKKTVAVAVPESRDIMLALQRAHEEGIAEAALAGDREKIEQLRRELKLDFPIKALVDAKDEQTAAQEAVKLIVSGQAQVLMKGNLHTSSILSALLNKEYGLRTERPISHVFILEAKPCGRLLFVTDSAVNIAPDLERKKMILQNAIDLLHTLGYARPKAAVLAAVEDVKDKMPVTVDAAKLTQMALAGEITGADVFGPLALDDALSPWVCAEKIIPGPIQGDADILLVPTIEAGNMLSKAQMFIADGALAGIALGAKIPMVLNSRADTPANRFYAMAVACLAAGK
ncbi:MAG: bifunctional enoyl-CoA hydratase/phosphate acetyltransferase [Candidatus Firestonebacteria bacterium]|nr:bifunctional enoyl-CoA hydratase/phosphate acetyltransferase [Candidatus Firestonebacteria bacterium]